MLIETKTTKRRRTIIGIFHCDNDHCTSFFQKHLSKVGTFQFCSRHCYWEAMKKGSIVCKEYASRHDYVEWVKKVRQTTLKKYNVSWPSKRDDVKKKIVIQNFEKYGVAYLMQSANIRAKSRKTCQEKYGTDVSSKAERVKAKMRETCIKKYGVDNPYKSQEIRARIKNTLVQRYGKNPFKSLEIRKKTMLTNLARYNAPTPMQSEEIKLKFDFKAASKKAHETMKRNGTYGKSKSEDLFYEWLCKTFGVDDIERQVRLNNWNIDFYIKSIDTYVQFDGVYWHGKDRAKENISKYKNLRDVVIYQTYLRDIEQNNWAKNNCIL